MIQEQTIQSIDCVAGLLACECCLGIALLLVIDKGDRNKLWFLAIVEIDFGLSNLNFVFLFNT